jgi:cytochrome P450
VDLVSVELTARMLATLFDFPYADRRKLTWWSDVTTFVAADHGRRRSAGEVRARELAECVQVFSELWRERASRRPAAI